MSSLNLCFIRPLPAFPPTIPAERSVFVQPWYPAKSAPSFADALNCLRRVLWQDKIKFMFGKRFVHNKHFEFLIEALASAASMLGKTASEKRTLDCSPAFL
jgi:hypothetical protein